MSKKAAKILLVGNPNVGKSVIFNRLTGSDAVVSNYPGTTVDYTEGTFISGKQEYTVIDVPGAYSLEARDKAEEVAVRMLHEHRDATVVVVLDSTRIERGLYIALETIEMGRSVLIVLNMIDMAHDRKISVDDRKLQKLLGVPVVPLTAITGEGVMQLSDMIHKAQISDVKDILARAEGRASEPAQVSGCAGCDGCGGC